MSSRPCNVCLLPPMLLVLTFVLCIVLRLVDDIANVVTTVELLHPSLVTLTGTSHPFWPFCPFCPFWPFCQWLFGSGLTTRLGPVDRWNGYLFCLYYNVLCSIQQIHGPLLVYASGGDIWGRHLRETSGGDIWWRHLGETSGGDIWWRHLVGTMSHLEGTWDRSERYLGASGRHLGILEAREVSWRKKLLKVLRFTVFEVATPSFV